MGRFEERYVNRVHACANCTHACLFRGWNPDLERYQDEVYCMLDLDKDDIHYAYEIIEKQVGFDDSQLTPRLIQIMKLKEDHPCLLYGSPRKTDDNDFCQFWEKGGERAYRGPLPPPGVKLGEEKPEEPVEVEAELPKKNKEKKKSGNKKVRKLIKKLKKVVDTWKGGDTYSEEFPKIFAKMKALVEEYDPELLEKLKSRYYDNEQAAEFIRAQATLEDMDRVLYYVDHLTGIYELDRCESKENDGILCDVGPYEPFEYLVELLGEDPKDYRSQDKEDDDEGYLD